MSSSDITRQTNYEKDSLQLVSVEAATLGLCDFVHCVYLQ